MQAVQHRPLLCLTCRAAPTTVVRFIAGRFYVLQLDAWSIPLWIGGIVWLLFGWSTFRWALPSIAFLWLATPLPGTIEIVLSTPLQQRQFHANQTGQESQIFVLCQRD